MMTSQCIYSWLGLTLRKEVNIYMYNYKIPMKLECTSPMKTGSFTEHKAWFEKCVNMFNEKSAQSTINRKKIEIVDINTNEIFIDLYSEVQLGKAPGRALTMLSRMLLDDTKPDYDPYYEQQLFHGKLFTIDVTEAGWDNIYIEDQDLIKALVDYGMKPKSAVSDKQKKAVEQIKKIAVESGICEGKIISDKKIIGKKPERRLDSFQKLYYLKKYDFKNEVVQFDKEDEITKFNVYEASGEFGVAAEEIGKLYAKYKYNYNDKEADSCSLMQEIYDKLWNKLWDKEILSHYRDKVKLYGDTMNSCNITLNKLFSEKKEYILQSANLTQDKKQELEKVTGWSKRASILLYVNDKKKYDEIINLYNGAKKFLTVAYTLGNFIPVPKVFNNSRGYKNKKIEDYWDLTLLAIYNWFMEQTKKPIVYNINLIDVVQSEENETACGEWLNCFRDDNGILSWDDFVEKNYLQDFVKSNESNNGNKYGMPEELWDGHFNGDVLPTKEDDFSQFFINASEWITKRGEKMVDELNKRMKSQEEEK